MLQQNQTDYKKLKRKKLVIIVLCSISLLIALFLIFSKDKIVTQGGQTAKFDSFDNNHYNEDLIENYNQKQTLAFYKTKEQFAPEDIKKKLEELRKIIADSNYNFEVGYTSVLDKSIAEITGELELSSTERDKIKARLDIIDSIEEINGLDKSSDSYITINGTTLLPSLARLDLREYGLVTPVKDQNPAGACWAFGAMAAYESSYKIKHKRDIQTSEQYVINCSKAGTAKNGGIAISVFDWMLGVPPNAPANVDSTPSTPYLAIDMACASQKPKTDYFAISWRLVHPSNNANAIPTVRQIKEAICKHGAISASVYVSSLFQGLTTEVLKEKVVYKGTNHAVCIIGWDESKSAWIIKNSWGSELWGSNCGFGDEKVRGYGYINYFTNNIGRRAAWVEAK